MNPSIKLIKFRHVLKHKAGFRPLGTGDMGADGEKRFFDYMKKGVKETDVFPDIRTRIFHCLPTCCHAR